MKVEQGEVKFQPVTITFEHKSEWKYFTSFMEKVEDALLGERTKATINHICLQSSDGRKLITEIGEQQTLLKLSEEINKAIIIKGNNK